MLDNKAGAAGQLPAVPLEAPLKHEPTRGWQEALPRLLDETQRVSAAREATVCQRLLEIQCECEMLRTQVWRLGLGLRDAQVSLSWQITAFTAETYFEASIIASSGRKLSALTRIMHL